MEMANNNARRFERRRCRGDVLVSKLGGGPRLKGALVDISSGGARVILDRPLHSGEVIRLILPGRPGKVHHSGRIMIGQVLHSGGVPGRHVVGIGFGWYKGGEKTPRSSGRTSGLWSWLSGFLPKREDEVRPSGTKVEQSG